MMTAETTETETEATATAPEIAAQSASEGGSGKNAGEATLPEKAPAETGVSTLPETPEDEPQTETERMIGMLGEAAAMTTFFEALGRVEARLPTVRQLDAAEEGVRYLMAGQGNDGPHVRELRALIINLRQAIEHFALDLEPVLRVFRTAQAEEEARLAQEASDARA